MAARSFNLEATSMDTTQGTGFSDIAARTRQELAQQRASCWRSQARAWLGRIRGDQAPIETVAAESYQSTQHIAQQCIAYLGEELANYQGHPHGQKMRLELVERLRRYL
jgi:hypothetical protein